MKHFDIKTLGRDPNAGVIKMYTKKDYLAKKDGKSAEDDPMVVLASQLIQAYGGQENIKNVDACITKLRVQVADRSKTNKQRILGLGARGVVYPSNQSVYAVFSTQADILKDIISGKIKAPVINQNGSVATTKSCK
ncbi:MAG: glucose PTS transporter subunit EIIB [Mycoplasmoidaceae bacterium]|nr:glucose PTS transporter subunit EIIB [Mycoplasmoidaceae bacterium]